MSDVMDLARSIRVSTFGQPTKTLKASNGTKSAAPAPFYLRMTLQDKPGALSKIAAALSEAGISIDRMRQYGHEDSAAPVLIVTHKTTRSALDEAILGMSRTDVLVSEPIAIRIETV
jgi:homoserine dehydrogenase